MITKKERVELFTVLADHYIEYKYDECLIEFVDVVHPGNVDTLLALSKEVFASIEEIRENIDRLDVLLYIKKYSITDPEKINWIKYNSWAISHNKTEIKPREIEAIIDLVPFDNVGRMKTLLREWRHTTAI